MDDHQSNMGYSLEARMAGEDDLVWEEQRVCYSLCRGGFMGWLCEVGASQSGTNGGEMEIGKVNMKLFKNVHLYT